MLIPKSTLILVAIATAAIIPASSKPRTKRLSRGPAFTTNLERLNVRPADLEAARKLREQFRRVVVLALSEDVDDEGISNAHIVAELLHRGLRYGKGLILVDPLSRHQVFDTLVDTTQRVEAARKNDIDTIVLVRVSGQPLELRIDIVSVANGNTQPGEALFIKDESASLIAAAVKARRSTLDRLQSSAGPHGEQLDRLPLGEIDALKHLFSAQRTIAKAVLEDADDKRAKTLNDALEKADLAIASSTKLLEAYVLKATCHDELGNKRDVIDTLRRGRRQLNPRKHDLLTQQELLADYARFVTNRDEDSKELYENLLKTEPTSLTGMWAVIDILLTGNGRSPIDDEQVKLANEYAAKVIVLHSTSGVAQMIQR